MKIDGPCYARLEDAAAEAKRLAAIGYDGVYTLEGNSDPFLPLALVSEHAPELEIGTGIAVAFPRNPMHIAYQAWDLQRYSKGRFWLGVGSQVRAHIENRFGLEFKPAAARMREYIAAVKAIFSCWQQGSTLNFEGEYFRHTLMTPMFDAGPLESGPPPVLLGAVGPKMTQVAGEVADGIIVHPFHTMPFIRQVTEPAIEAGLAKSAREAGDFTVQVNAIVITGDSEETRIAAQQSVCGLLGFYGSTPAYRGPMEAIGQGDLQPELNRLTKAGEWDELSKHINEDFLDAFTVRGRPEDIAGMLLDKYSGFADRIAIYAPYAAADELWRDIINDFKRSWLGGG